MKTDPPARADLKVGPYGLADLKDGPHAPADLKVGPHAPADLKVGPHALADLKDGPHAPADLTVGPCEPGSTDRRGGPSGPPVELTPYQPVGPYFHVMLRDEPAGYASLVTDAVAGRHVTIAGTVLDGAGTPVTDALVEIWQADRSGRYAHPADPTFAAASALAAATAGKPAAAAADPAFRGYGRTATDRSGRFRFDTVKPGAVAGPDGQPQAPHILIALFAPGILTRYWTRLYFDDEQANEGDAVLNLVPEHRRATLIAKSAAPGTYTFDIRLQGAEETVFFET